MFPVRPAFEFRESDLSVAGGADHSGTRSGRRQALRLPSKKTRQRGSLQQTGRASRRRRLPIQSPAHLSPLLFQ